MNFFNSRKHLIVRWVILGVFIASFVLPVVLTPSLMFKQIFPGNQRLQYYIKKLTYIKEPFTVTRPEFSFQAWFNGTFQGEFNKYYNKEFLMRKPFIELSNQLYYTLFDKSYMYLQSIIIGKEKQLYEIVYINDYCRLNTPLSSDQTEVMARDIAEVQQQLRRRGVAFLVLITPSKASVYPEYIPDPFMKRKTDANRDYDNMIPLFLKYSINYIDGREITLAAKKETNLPLFCRGGTHWNDLGAFFTVDALIKKIESLKGTPITHISCDKVKVDRKPYGTDRDLARLLYILFPSYDYITPHPHIKPVSGMHDFKGNIVFVGGSFTNFVLNMLYKNKIFNSMDFYFYYKNARQTFPHDTIRESTFKVENIDWERDFFKKDVIVLEINESSFQSGHIMAFLTDALNHLSSDKEH